jgi:hypothetical protein
MAATFSGAVIGTVTTLTDAASVALNLAQGNNFYVQMTSAVGTNRVLENPTNAVIGQCGSIYVIQTVSGTINKTLSYGNAYRFKNGTAPTITLTTSAVDLLVYNVRDVSIIDVIPIQNFKPEA